MYALTFKEEEMYSIPKHHQGGMPKGQTVTIPRMTEESCEDAAKALGLENYEIKPV